MIPTLLLLAAFVLLLAAAAVWDVATMTIPNWISIAMTALFPLAALFAGWSLSDLGVNLGLGFAVLVVTFTMFQFKLLGGGDAKLMAATSVWVGLAGVLPFLIWMVIAGGALSMLLIVTRRFAYPGEGKPEWANRLLDRKKGAPYAVAISTGGLIALMQSKIFLNVFG
jgi:prepilin peptidase CpaA